MNARVVIGTRGEPPVGQHAQRGDPIRVSLEAGALGAGGQVPQPDRAAILAL